MDLRRVVGKDLKDWRVKRGYPQEELAFRSELHRTYVSAVERGLRNPTVVIIGRLAQALQIRPVLLLDAYAGADEDMILGDGQKAQASELASCAALAGADATTRAASCVL
jgi:transcriptional regulator with XRE-family HTH domain